MRKLLFVPLLVLLYIHAYSQAAITRYNSNLRDSATTTSNVLIRIPQGTEIYIESCSDGWCQTTYQGNTGYIRTTLLQYEDGNESTSVSSTRTSNAHGPIKYYTNTAGERVQSPTTYDQAPAGATAQCWDGTYSFSQNHRGTCSHHGGVKRWL